MFFHSHTLKRPRICLTIETTYCPLKAHAFQLSPSSRCSTGAILNIKTYTHGLGFSLFSQTQSPSHFHPASPHSQLVLCTTFSPFPVAPLSSGCFPLQLCCLGKAVLLAQYICGGLCCVNSFNLGKFFSRNPFPVLFWVSAPKEELVQVLGCRNKVLTITLKGLPRGWVQ